MKPSGPLGSIQVSFQCLTSFSPWQNRSNTAFMFPPFSMEMRRVWSSSFTQTKKFFASLCLFEEIWKWKMWRSTEQNDKSALCISTCNFPTHFSPPLPSTFAPSPPPSLSFECQPINICFLLLYFIVPHSKKCNFNYSSDPIVKVTTVSPHPLQKYCKMISNIVSCIGSGIYNPAEWYTPMLKELKQVEAVKYIKTLPYGWLSLFFSRIFWVSGSSQASAWPTHPLASSSTKRLCHTNNHNQWSIASLSDYAEFWATRLWHNNIILGSHQMPRASGQSRAIPAHVRRGETGLSKRKWSSMSCCCSCSDIWFRG